jgi:hypothetical protein
LRYQEKHLSQFLKQVSESNSHWDRLRVVSWMLIPQKQLLL